MVNTSKTAAHARCELPGAISVELSKCQGIDFAAVILVDQMVSI